MGSTGQEERRRWHGPAVGLMDLDAFFASVEQLDHPAWRGKPVIVGGDAERRGVVSTASYEAREFGVRSAMPSYQAKRLCPQAIWTHGNHARYREMSGRVMRILEDETPFVEQVSIDEAFFDITPGTYVDEDPRTICRRIQARVSEMGITCSIGLSTSKTVAKIASERDKPRGLTVVEPGSEEAFLAPLPVRTLSGIGAATEQTLKKLGVRTLGDLAQQDPNYLQIVLGVQGPRLIERARGTQRSPVRSVNEAEPVKSVSCERTFAQDLTTAPELYAAIGHVAEQTGMRLRRKGLAGTQVTLKLKFDYAHTHTAQCRLPRPTDDEHVFGPVAQKLLDGLWKEGTPVRLVGVALSNFNAAAEQLTLFPTEGGESFESQREAANKSRKLAQVTDRLRKRFGNDAISYGRDLRL